MFLTDSPILESNLAPVWEEKELFYDFRESNKRLKNFTFNIDEVLN
jgi:hypothetical protein